jgi:glycosyltransferase involved in cell wall biosynthesis
MARIVILISTYNRPELLRDLLLDISKLDCDYKVKIYNDCSTEDYSPVYLALAKLNDYEYRMMDENYGKRGFWQLHNVMYEELINEEFDYVIQMLDDMRLVKNFYPQVVDQFNHCGADMLNIILPSGTKEHFENKKANIVHSNGYSFWDYCWNDLCYITTRKYFERINFECPPIPWKWFLNPSASSGVSSALTLKFQRMGGTIKVVTKSLLLHTGQVSQFNPQRSGYYSV